MWNFLAHPRALSETSDVGRICDARSHPPQRVTSCDAAVQYQREVPREIGAMDKPTIFDPYSAASDYRIWVSKLIRDVREWMVGPRGRVGGRRGGGSGAWYAPYSHISQVSRLTRRDCFVAEAPRSDMTQRGGSLRARRAERGNPPPMIAGLAKHGTTGLLQLDRQSLVRRDIPLPGGAWLRNTGSGRS